MIAAKKVKASNVVEARVPVREREPFILDYSLSQAERRAAIAWLRHRVDEMRSNRGAVMEKYGCDLMSVLSRLADCIPEHE